MQQQQQPSTSNIMFLPHQQVPQQQSNTAVTIGSQQKIPIPTTMQQQQFGTALTTSASLNQKTEKLQPEKRINPYGLPSQMFTGYERHSIETLCTLGRELVTELMNRMLFMLGQLKMNIKGGDIKQNKGMPQQQQHVSNNIDAIRLHLEYSKLLFMALTEIRLRIDLKLIQELQDGQKLKDSRPSDDELLRMLSDSEQLRTTKRETGDEESDDNDDESKDNVPMEQDNNLKQEQVKLDPEIDAKKAEMDAQFEKNRQQIIHLDCQLKKLEWLAMCSDPPMLNNRDSSGNAPMISQSKKRSDEVGSSIGAGQASRRS